MPRATRPVGSLPPRPSPDLDQLALAQALRLLREWSGVKLAALKLPPSTSSAKLRGDRFPTWEFVYTLTTTCLSRAGLDPARELPQWEKAWSHVERQVKEHHKNTPKLGRGRRSTPMPPVVEQQQQQQVNTPDQSDSDSDPAEASVSVYAASARYTAAGLVSRVIEIMCVGMGWLAAGPVGRFVTGAAVFGDPKCNATFTRTATTWYATGQELGWSIAPGWFKAVIRLVVVSVAWIIAVNLLPHPWILVTGLAVAAIVLGYVRRWVRYWRYTAALFDRLRLIFQLPASEEARDWVTVPRNVDVVRDRSQSVRLRIPQGWHTTATLHIPEYDDTNDGDPQTRPWQQLVRIVDRHLPGEWDHASLSGSQRDRVLLCHRANAAPPTYYDPAGFSSVEIPLGSTGRGEPFTANLDTDRPHMLFAGPARWAQQMAMMPISHIAHHGGVVDVCTPNRILPSVYHALDSVRVHTEKFATAREVAQFVASLIAVYREEASDYSNDTVTRMRLLVLDNFDQLHKLLDLARREHGKCTTMADVIDLLVNDHTRGHFLVVTTPYPHMKNLAPFIGKFGTIVAAGHHGPRAWQTMFGNQIQPTGTYPPGYAVAGDKHRIFDIRPCLITPSIARATAHTPPSARHNHHSDDTPHPAS
jgi:hypothetical protein